MQSLMNAAEKSPIFSRENTFDTFNAQMILDSRDCTNNDEGLFIVTKSKSGGMEIYAISDFNRSIKVLPKYHIDTDKINIDTVRVFARRDRIFFSFMKDHRLMIKAWSFNRQIITDVKIPSTIVYSKPRVTNSAGGSFYVAEEKYVTWPSDGYKTTICKFGLDTECYKCIEVNCGGMKEIIGLGDEIFLFNQVSGADNTLLLNAYQAIYRSSVSLKKYFFFGTNF